MQATNATEATRLRDARKTADEPVKSMSFRAPVSIADYLQGHPEGITSTILESVELKRDLDKLLESVRPDLVKAAAEIGKEYTFSQAETIAHVVKRCLAQAKPKK